MHKIHHYEKAHSKPPTAIETYFDCFLQVIVACHLPPLIIKCYLQGNYISIYTFVVLQVRQQPSTDLKITIVKSRLMRTQNPTNVLAKNADANLITNGRLLELVGVPILASFLDMTVHSINSHGLVDEFVMLDPVFKDELEPVFKDDLKMCKIIFVKRSHVKPK